MTRKAKGSTLGAALLMAASVAVAAPAYAQYGSVQGRVIDEQGNPVAGAEITYEFTGDMSYRFTGESNDQGEFIRAGLMASGGTWNITAVKDGLAGRATNVDVPLGGTSNIVEIVVRSGFRIPGADPDADERNRMAAELKGLLDRVNAAIEAQDYASAATALQEAAARVEGCSLCYLRLGDVYRQQGNLDEAVTAYNTAVEMDPNDAEAYEGLAVVYNTQKKFAEAGAASAKASELRAASGSAQDATSLFNSGAILVNSGDMAGAQAQFERAIQVDPTMADAHYQLAMTLVNQGKIAEAIPALEQYLVLDPNGANAETANLMLPELRKMMPQ